MPTLKMKTNLGTPDAKRLGLDPRKAREGQTISAEGEVYDELIRKGWAGEPDAEPETVTVEPSTLRAIPGPISVPAPGSGFKADATTSPAKPDDEGDEAPDLESMTKAELADFAAKRGIDGVSTDQTKADMIAKIEDALTQ